MKTLTLQDLSKQELIELITQHYPVKPRDIRRVRHETLLRKGSELHDQGMALMRQYTGKQDWEGLQGYRKGLDLTEAARKLYDQAEALLTIKDDPAPDTQQDLI